MDKVVLEVTHVAAEKHAGVAMSEDYREAMKCLGLITQTVTLKPVDRNKPSEANNEVHIDPIKITLPGNELNLGDRFTLELTPVR